MSIQGLCLSELWPSLKRTVGFLVTIKKCGRIGLCLIPKDFVMAHFKRGLCENAVVITVGHDSVRKPESNQREDTWTDAV